MTFEWDASKAAANLRKHHVAFEDAASVFLDPLAITFSDPDHSVDEHREITIGCTIKGKWCSFPTATGTSRLGSSVCAPQHAASENSMKKEPASKRRDDLRPEYDLSRLEAGVRGKYHRRATAGTNLVLIEPDLVSLFPDSKTVNRALRLLAEAGQSATSPKRRRRRLG